MYRNRHVDVNAVVLSILQFDKNFRCMCPALQKIAEKRSHQWHYVRECHQKLICRSSQGNNNFFKLQKCTQLRQRFNQMKQKVQTPVYPEILPPHPLLEANAGVSLAAEV